jgi:hypothetical protein
MATCHRPLPVPEPVSLLGPADGAVLRSAAAVLSWEPGEDASYEVQVSASSTFKTLALDTVTQADTQPVALGVDDDYFWRVRPLSAGSVWGEWSETWSIRLERFRLVASVATKGYPHDVAVVGNRAYVADGEAGLVAFDVTNPESPMLIATKILDSLNVAWGVAARDSLVYVAYGQTELIIVNAARPESMRVVSALGYAQPATGYDVALADSFVYVAADAQFIKVGIADPRYPNLVFQGYYPRDCQGVAVSGGNAFVALGQLGIASWRIDTVPPIQVGSLDTPGKARAICVSGSYCYVADGLSGFEIIDISDPANPVRAGSLDLNGYAYAVAVQDTFCYLSCGVGGVQVVNVARPDAPSLVATIPSNYAMGVCPVGRYLYAGDRDLGLLVIKQEE